MIPFVIFGVFLAVWLGGCVWPRGARYQPEDQRREVLDRIARVMDRRA